MQTVYILEWTLAGESVGVQEKENEKPSSKIIIVDDQENIVIIEHNSQTSPHDEVEQEPISEEYLGETKCLAVTIELPKSASYIDGTSLFDYGIPWLFPNEIINFFTNVVGWRVDTWRKIIKPKYLVQNTYFKILRI